MVRVNIYGEMEINIKVIFKMVWDGEKDFGSKKLKKAFNFIKVNMWMIRKMDMVIFIIQMVLNILVNLMKIKEMDLEKSYGQKGLNIKDIGNKV